MLFEKGSLWAGVSQKSRHSTMQCVTWSLRRWGKNQWRATRLSQSSTVGTPGVLDTLQLVKDTQCALGEFGLEDIEIEANVCGLDFRDILVGFGRIRVDDLGIDYGVIITRGWPACKSDIRPGGSACVVSLGSMWTIVRSHRTSLRKVS